MAFKAYQVVDPLPFQPASNAEQNFERHFVADVDGIEGNDQSLYIHPNGLCVIGLASSHAALQQGECMQGTDCSASDRQSDAMESSIDFDVGRRSLLEAEFRKGRGPLLNPDSALCRLTVGGQPYMLRCLAKGALVDVNERLNELEGAELLRQLQHSYIAIVSLRHGEAERIQQECLSAEQYAKLKTDS